MRRLWGALLVVVGGLFMASPLLLRGYDTYHQKVLMAEAPHPVRVGQDRTGSVPRLPQPALGTVMGTIRIPAIHVDAAFVQGTTESLLLGAPGHFDGSVLPGEDGLSVIAGHNATYFHFLNRLTPHDVILVTTQQGTFRFQETFHAIWPANAGLPNSSAPTLALEACYPLNALYFTPDRYIVFARLVKASPVAQVPTGPASVSPYQPAILPAIYHAYNLLLQDNNLPQGTLTYQGPVSSARLAAFIARGTPLSLVNAAVELVLAYQDTSQHGQVAWRNALFLAGNSADNPYGDHAQIQYIDRVNYVITLNGEAQPTAITVIAPDVLVNGQAMAIRWQMTIRGSHVYLTAVDARPLS